MVSWDGSVGQERRGVGQERWGVGPNLLIINRLSICLWVIFPIDKCLKSWYSMSYPPQQNLHLPHQTAKSQKEPVDITTEDINLSIESGEERRGVGQER